MNDTRIEPFWGWMSPNRNYCSMLCMLHPCWHSHNRVTYHKRAAETSGILMLRAMKTFISRLWVSPPFWSDMVFTFLYGKLGYSSAFIGDNLSIPVCYYCVICAGAWDVYIRENEILVAIYGLNTVTILATHCVNITHHILSNGDKRAQQML